MSASKLDFSTDASEPTTSAMGRSRVNRKPKSERNGTEGMMDNGAAELASLEKELVAFFVEAGAIYGIPKSLTTIYAVCFASPNPLSFADIKARAKLSQGSVSQGISILRSIGALKLHAGGSDVAGSHPEAKGRDFYVPEFELRKLAMRLVEQKVTKQLSIAEEMLRRITQAVPASDSEISRELGTRVGYLQTWHHKGRALLPVVRSFLG